MTIDSDPVRDESGGGLLDALVAGERAAMQPPESAKKDTWKRVVGTVAVDAPLPVEPTSIAGPAAGAPWLKIVLGIVLGGAVAVGAYRLANDPEPEVSTTAAATPEPDRAPPPPAPAPQAQPPVQPAAPVVVPEPAAPAEEPEAAPAKTVRPTPREPDDEPPPASDLAEETHLLARARAHIRAGSPRKALTPLGEHARRFPQGQLAEDRMVLKAQALCEGGDTDAGLTQAAALRKAFPGSSHLARVQRACE